MFEVPATAYDRFMGRYSAPLAPEFAAAAGVREGDTVLDVGCGPGALTSVLAELLGPENVAAVDPSPPFAEACRNRLPGVRVETAPAESLPFEDDSFDAALAQLVVAFMNDAPAGVREMKRVVKPGGRVAAAMWAEKEGMELLHVLWTAVHAVRPTAEEDAERGVKFRTEAEIGDLLRSAELNDVSVTSATVSSEYADVDELWGPVESGVGPVGAYVKKHLSADERAAIRRDLGERFGDGSFALHGRAWIATGTA